MDVLLSIGASRAKINSMKGPLKLKRAHFLRVALRCVSVI